MKNFLQTKLFIRLAAASQLIVILCAVGLVAYRHPSSSAMMPECPSRTLLGVQCPGCGSTRAIHYTTRGQFADAWRHNPLMLLLGVPASTVYGIFLWFAVLNGRWMRLPDVPAIYIWVVLGGVIVFGIARNVPGFSALRPPP